jgi:hypothetical protein
MPAYQGAMPMGPRPMLSPPPNGFGAPSAAGMSAPTGTGGNPAQLAAMLQRLGGRPGAGGMMPQTPAPRTPAPMMQGSPMPQMGQRTA